MTLASTFRMTKLTGGGTIGLHGAHGVIHLSTVQGERFKRAVSNAAGYQRLGMDVEESSIDFWHACATATDAATVKDSLYSFCYQAVTVDHATRTGLRCVCKTVRITQDHASKGPLITGSTYATWRIEGTITLERAP